MTQELIRHPNPASEDSISRLKALVLDSLISPHSKRSYALSIDEFLRWHQTTYPDRGFTKAAVNAYKAYLLTRGLAPSSINLRITAVKKLAEEAGDNQLMDSDLARGISKVKGVSREGVRIGNWLTQAQAEELINSPDVSTLKGKRDRALLALMIGSGLRRDEVSSLCVEHIQMREARWMIVDLMGKGRKVRSVPIPSFVKAALDVWTIEAGSTFLKDVDLKTFRTDGRGDPVRIFLPINKGDHISGYSMTPQAVFDTIKHYAQTIGLPNLAPHDLRRTFAKLAHSGHAALEQIQLSLGHKSIMTTERYLGVKQDLTDAPCDHLGLKL